MLGGIVLVVAAVAAVALNSDDPSIQAEAAPVETTETRDDAVASTMSSSTTSTTTSAAQAPVSSSTTTDTSYRSSVEAVSVEELGTSYTPGRGCAEPAALRAVNVRHWGDEGTVHEGRIIVAATQAEAVETIFGDLFAARFPITSIIPVDRFDADDQASMRANNTSGYNCRTVAGTTKLSNHALGLAIDVNPLVNPYVKGSVVDPPEGTAWADRSADHPGMIRDGDVAVQAFARHGWAWGGHWSSPDYQHFSTSGT